MSGSESLKIRGSNGTSAANITIGGNSSTSGDTTSYGGTLNTAGANNAATLDALVGTLALGNAQANAAGGQAVSSGTFTMGAGTLTAATVNLGTVSGASATNTLTGNGTLSITGGTANISTLNFGVDTAVAGQTSVTLNDTLNLNTGSTLNATNVQLGSVTTGQTVTRNATINWNDGTIGNIAGTNLAIGAGLNIVTAGSGANHGFNISSGQTGAVQSIISGTGPISKIGAGTLTLSGANTYTGATNIAAGTLAVTANNALGTVAGNTTVASNATLDLQNVTYSTAESVAVASGGNIAASTGVSSFAGAISNSGLATYNIGGTSLNLSGPVTGTTSLLTKTGAGTLTLWERWTTLVLVFRSTLALELWSSAKPRALAFMLSVPTAALITRWC